MIREKEEESESESAHRAQMEGVRVEQREQTATPTTNVECQKREEKKQKWFLTLHKVQNADSIVYRCICASLCFFRTATLSTSHEIYELAYVCIMYNNIFEAKSIFDHFIHLTHYRRRFFFHDINASTFK